MTMKRLLGCVVLSLPFLAVAAYLCSYAGPMAVLITFGMVAAILGCVWLGVELLLDA
jgi:hypothetical protein